MRASGVRRRRVALDAGYGGAGEGQRVVGDAAPGVDLVGVVGRAAVAALAAGDARQAVVPVTAIGDEPIRRNRPAGGVVGQARCRRRGRSRGRRPRRSSARRTARPSGLRIDSACSQVQLMQPPPLPGGARSAPADATATRPWRGTRAAPPDRSASPRETRRTRIGLQEVVRVGRAQQRMRPHAEHRRQQVAQRLRRAARAPARCETPRRSAAGRIGADSAVPAAQLVQRARFEPPDGRQVLDQQARHPPRRQADLVGLQRAEVHRRVAVLAFEHLADAAIARRVDELAGEEVRAAACHVVVGVGPQPVGRVEGARQIVELERAAPLVLAAPARRRHQALRRARAPARGRPSGSRCCPRRRRTVMFSAGVPQRSRRGAELVPRSGAIDVEQRRRRRRRLEHHRPQAPAADARRPGWASASAAGRGDWVISTSSIQGWAWPLIAMTSRIGRAGLPAPGELGSPRVAGVDALDVQVLDVGHGGGDAPGDMSVVADENARRARRAGASDVQLAAGGQMGLVEHARQARKHVRIVGQQRLARAGARARDRPGVACAGPAGERDAAAARRARASRADPNPPGVAAHRYRAARRRARGWPPPRSRRGRSAASGPARSPSWATAKRRR